VDSKENAKMERLFFWKEEEEGDGVVCNNKGVREMHAKKVFPYQLGTTHTPYSSRLFFLKGSAMTYCMRLRTRGDVMQG
jgi:hypothetical protein